ncbi:hypothetical protein HDC91_000255 [Mucilaginibacter sp. AK015]|nr:hypothetical protein [Mucilaginibacter sp. AK015]
MKDVLPKEIASYPAMTVLKGQKSLKTFQL